MEKMMKRGFRYAMLLFTMVFLITSCDDSEESPQRGVPIVREAQAIFSEGFTLRFFSVLDATGYELDISTTEDFSSFADGYNARALSSDGDIIITGLSENTQYYVRLRAVFGDEKGDYSAVRTVTTLSKAFEAGTLKGVASFPVGNIVVSNRLEGEYEEIFSREFNSITAEWEMKMDQILRGENDYNWEPTDKIVSFAQSIGAQVHGHALVWHQSTPGFLENFSGTNAEFEQIVKDYITAVLTRYKGKVVSWDVVNEAVEDGSNALRNSVFRQKMGDDYIRKCFQFAREADPDVLLFYNDYNMEWDAGKLNAGLNIVDDLGDRIDGFGFQMHININTSMSTLANHTQQVVDKGLLVHYAELDVRVNPGNPAGAPNFTFNDEVKAKQKATYKAAAETFINTVPADQRFALTVWGIKDSDSWIRPFFEQNEFPLLYDDNFEEKDAFEGLLEGLSTQ